MLYRTGISGYRKAKPFKEEVLWNSHSQFG